MEKKIGEVFELDGNWYQCIRGTGCKNCAFSDLPMGCTDDYPCFSMDRSDGREVIYKRLEKVEDGVSYDIYQAYTHPSNEFRFAYVYSDNRIVIRRKQKKCKTNKEDMDMEEIKRIEIPTGYVFDRLDGDSIVLKKNMPSLSDLRDYDACYTLMYNNGNISNEEMGIHVVPKGMNVAIDSLCKLLICRDAWWQTLGWKPDRADRSKDVYVITNVDNKISKTFYPNYKRILSFPTEKVRDEFLDCYKDLIEEAKELL